VVVVVFFLADLILYTALEEKHERSDVLSLVLEAPIKRQKD